MNSDKDIYTDPLFVGLTRPTTMWGIPDTAFIIEFVVTVLIFLAVDNPLYLLLAIPIHAALYLMSANNPIIFSSIGIWMKTNGRCRNLQFWNAVSFSPLPVKKWQD
jgi:type IV secretion system protein VirB3